LSDIADEPFEAEFVTLLSWPLRDLESGIEKCFWPTEETGGSASNRNKRSRNSPAGDHRLYAQSLPFVQLI